jgi:hypothetical protein
LKSRIANRGRIAQATPAKTSMHDFNFSISQFSIGPAEA